MPSETDDSSIRIILEAICAGGHIEMDFKEVAKTFGISRSDHAGTKVQAQLKRWGYKYGRASKALIKIDGAAGLAAPATPKKKPSTTGEHTSDGAKSSNKKRKLNKHDSDQAQGGDAAAGDGAHVAKEESEPSH